MRCLFSFSSLVMLYGCLVLINCLHSNPIYNFLRVFFKFINFTLTKEIMCNKKKLEDG